jgi:hypothetical protein
MNKMLKVIFPYSYVHSFTPGQMHDHFVKIFNELRDAQVIPGGRPENLKSASQDMSQFDRGVHQGISEVYRSFMVQLTPEVSELLCLNKQLKEYGVPADNIKRYVTAILATCGLIDQTVATYFPGIGISQELNTPTQRKLLRKYIKGSQIDTGCNICLNDFIVVTASCTTTGSW